MAEKARRTVLVIVFGLLVVASAGCATVKPETVPHYMYLGTYGGAIASQDGALEDEQELLDEMAQGVGWWTAFRGAEHLIAEAAGRALTWWEKLLVWALPIAINVKRIVHNMRP